MTLVAHPRVGKRALFKNVRAVPTPAVLGVITVMQLIAMTTLQNSAFQDEALYLYSGKDLWHSFLAGSRPFDNYGTYFSGLPTFYPMIAGALDQAGGLEAARGLSMACALWLTVVVFLVGRAFFGRSAGLLGALVFAVQAPVLFIGRLATYDALALALLGSTLALATTRPRTWKTCAMMVLVTLSVLAKYATAVFLPSAVILCLILMYRLGTKRVLVFQFVVAIATIPVIALGLHFVLLANPDVLEGLVSTTTNRSLGSKSPMLIVLGDAARYLGPFAALAIVGFLVLVLTRNTPSSKVAGVVLFGSVFIAPAYHVTTGELTSLDKHIAFGMMFGSPMVGLLLAFLATTHFLRRTEGLLVVVGILLVVCSTNFVLASKLFTTWPNTTEVTSKLHAIVRVNDSRVLSEEMEVLRFYLTPRVASGWQFTGTDYFLYRSRTGTTSVGQLAYLQAVRAGYFNVVVMRYGPSQGLDDHVTAALSANHEYQEVFVIPFVTSVGAGDFHVWLKTSNYKH